MKLENIGYVYERERVSSPKTGPIRKGTFISRTVFSSGSFQGLDRGWSGSLSKQKNKYLPPAHYRSGVERSLTEGLEDGVGLEDLLLHPRGDVGGDGAEVLHDVLGRLRLAGARLARDDEALGVDSIALKKGPKKGSKKGPKVNLLHAYA